MNAQRRHRSPFLATATSIIVMLTILPTSSFASTVSGGTGETVVTAKTAALPVAESGKTAMSSDEDGSESGSVESTGRARERTPKVGDATTVIVLVLCGLSIIGLSMIVVALASPNYGSPNYRNNKPQKQ
jgi:hypothetical protein